MKRIIISSYKPKSEIVKLLQALNINPDDVIKVWHNCKEEMTVKFKDGVMQRFLISHPKKEHGLGVDKPLKKVNRRK